ncbi:heparinase II/III family protein [Streptomyces arenae]|uniref:heparinase II/III family protein n=1 Tax=Streptomyces arenae TaxID=29301 RepID=UPI00265A80B2|nr:heparinase II/III family protein [Streptomyces arenae]MCG7205700.1 heparinase II/III family protein [Streptomyces arenae]
MSLTRRNLLQAILAGAAATPLLSVVTATSAAAATVSTEITDAAFFGAWNSATGTWTTTPVFDYDGHSAMASVAAAAKSGDYTTARTALLQYMRTRDTRVPPAWAYNGVYSTPLVPLFLDRIWTLGKGEIYQTTLTVGGDWTTLTPDVTAAVQGSVSAAGVGFMLMARDKESATAEFASRHAADNAPRLTLTYADGSVVTRSASQSTYIAAGTDTGTVFGSAETLVVHDEGTGAFSATTSKGYLWFDLSGVASPVSATLGLTGRTDGTSQDVMLYQVAVTFDETTRTWNNTVQNTFSWQADPKGFDWKKITGADVDSEFYYQLPRFYFAGPLADAYAASRDEKIAAGLIGLMTDFIADTNTSAYGAPSGAASYPRNLDAAWRYQNWSYVYEILRTSPSLTADANTSLLKAVYAAGPYFSTTTSTTANWMITIKSALAYLGVCFPEFTAAATWRSDALAFLVQQLGSSLYPDNGYIEASSTYAMGVATTFVGTSKVMAANDYDVGSVPPLSGLAWFLADQTYPNGYDPAYGDSSYTDQRASLASLARLLGDDELTYVATGGAEGTAPDHTSVTYPDTRVVVQRTGWTDTDWYLRMAADRGNHGHPDELAVQVYAHDRPLLPAMGAYAYVTDPVADWLRLTSQSHNTVTIDGLAQVPTAAGAVTNVSTPWADLADGYTDATPGVRHERSALFLHDLGWIVSDTLTPADSAEHSYEQNWHLLPDAALTLDGASAHTAFDSGTQLRITPADPGAATVALKDGYYSSVTYQVSPASYVSYSLTAAGTVRLDTLLLPVPEGTRPKARLSLAACRHDGRVLELRADSLKGYYLRAADDGTARDFGPYGYDGPLAYVDQDGPVQRFLLTGGTTLTEDGKDLLSAGGTLNGTLAVRLNTRDKTVEISGTAARADGAELVLKAPWAREVTVAGKSVSVARKRGTIVVAALT